MFRSIFHNCKKWYLKPLPIMVTFSGTVGLLAGIGNYHFDINDKNKCEKMKFYTYTIGYISPGILTGVIYPIRFPLCAYYVCKER